MKKIPLRDKRGDVIAYALVDDPDYPLLSSYRWSLSHGYVHRKRRAREQGPNHILLHRVICGVHGKEHWKTEIDHINRDKLDNRRVNLRRCSRSQNNANHGFFKGKQSKGVYKNKNGRYYAYINKEGIRYSLGGHNSSKEAQTAYNAAAKRLFGEFCASKVTRTV